MSRWTEDEADTGFAISIQILGNKVYGNFGGWRGSEKGSFFLFVVDIVWLGWRDAREVIYTLI